MTNGKLLSGLPVAVDFWKLPPSDGLFKTYLYFLTHLHTDHTKGLTSTWTETIYTSTLNRDLAIKMLKVNPELIKPLEIGVCHKMTLPSQYGKNDENQSKFISVTLVDANHIKGSVMFLFEGSFGRLLYTGDFRWCESMMIDPVLKNLSESNDLNMMYIDNTFEHIGNEFPTREQCTLEVLNIMNKHPYHRIIFGCQTIGKEDVLLQASYKRKEKVYIPETILNCYRLLSLPCEEIFTTDQTNSLLWFEKLNQISQFDLRKKNSEMPTIAIKLTASGLLYNSSKFKDDELIFTVPYSNHSSASELAKCLDFLKPNSVERIVKKNNLKKSSLSVIDSYLAAIKAAELTDDITSDSMELEQNSCFEAPVVKSQVPDSFYSTVSQFQSPVTNMETEYTALSEDIDGDFQSPVANMEMHCTALSEDIDGDDFQSPVTNMEMHCTALSEDMDGDIPLELESPSKPLVVQKSPLPIILSREREEFVTKADAIIDSIFSDLDQFKEDKNNENIYSDAFIEKLMTLHNIYHPITGVPMSI